MSAPCLQVLAAAVRQNGDQVLLTVHTHHEQSFTLALSRALAAGIAADLVVALSPAKRRRRRATGRRPILKPSGRIL